MIGLNSVSPPQLQNPFASLNQFALQQQAQAGGGFAPASVAAIDLPQDQTPDAGSALATLQSQMAAGATGPRAVAPAMPGGPASFSDALNNYANLIGGRLGGLGQNIANIPQNVMNNLANARIGQLFGGAGPMPSFAPVNPGQPAGVLDTRFANTPQGVLGG